MKQHFPKRLFTIVLSTLLALVLAGFAYSSLAAGTMAIKSNNMSVCPTTGATVQSVAQGEVLKFSLAGYHSGEEVLINFAFPDGRYMDLATAYSLDGVIGTMSASQPNTLAADNGGDVYFELKPSIKWPAGCYFVQATGLSSAIVSSDHFVVQAPTPPPPIGSATMTVGTDPGGKAAAPAGTPLQIAGQGFGANEQITISMIQPNGTKAAFPQAPSTSASGEFVVAFKFNEASLPGTYTFVAQGKQTSYNASATFVLLPLPVPPAPDTLTVIVTPNSLAPMSYHIEIQGEEFTPTEGITLKLRVPLSTATPSSPPIYGTTYSLPTVRANNNGKFAVAFDLTVGATYSSGSYLVIAEGSDSKKLAMAPFTIPPMMMGIPTVLPNLLSDAPTSTALATPSATAVVTATTAPTTTSVPVPTALTTPTPSPADQGNKGGVVDSNVIIINNYNTQEGSSNSETGSPASEPPVSDPPVSDPPASDSIAPTPPPAQTYIW